MGAGGVVGRGEEAADDSADDSLEEPGADNPGVESKSISSSSTSLVFAAGAARAISRELRVRLAILSEDAEDPEDSSKDRLGDR